MYYRSITCLQQHKTDVCITANTSTHRRKLLKHAQQTQKTITAYETVYECGKLSKHDWTCKIPM